MNQSRRAAHALSLLSLVALAACGSNDAPSSGVSTQPDPSNNAGNAGAGATGTVNPTAGAGGTGLVLDPPVEMPGGAPSMPKPPITGMTVTESGAYKRGDRIDNLGSAGGPNVEVNGDDGCGVLVGVVRDFRSKDPMRHPDFEAFDGQQVVKGLVASQLGADHKPVYASPCALVPDPALCPTGQQTTDKATFDQWYRDTPDVNQTHLIYFKMDPTGVGDVVSFRSENFVPMDGAGWDDTWQGLDGKPHNYGFTTELHIKFKYSGGESFTFKGDDDVWAFINGRLAMDLGGLHSELEDTIELDDLALELGLVKGEVYPLELFHAERHSNGSHFRIDSTLSVVDCGSVPIVPK